MITLTIITVSYNCADTIERTIDSVVSQLSDQIEYIIIDGGSTDGTKEIIEKYSSDIAYWISEKDNGVYDAMNKGIKSAKGEWISFINGDDWYIKDSLSKVIEKLSNSEYDICYGYVNAIKDGVKTGYFGISEYTDPDKIFLGNLYCHQGLFVKRELFTRIGLYDTQYRIFADYDWLLKAHVEGYDPYLIGMEVANFTLGGLSTVESENDEFQRIIIKHFRNLKNVSDKLEKIRGRADFVLLSKRNPDKFQELLKIYKNIYLWGLGKNGTECYELLKKNDLIPCLAIDSTPGYDFWHDIKVISSTGFLSDYCKDLAPEDVLIISSDKYEDEIETLILEAGIRKEAYLKMSDLYKWAYDHNDYI